MKYSYYPGCSLEGTAREFDESTRAVCARLGIELEELSDWNCCGANAAATRSEALARGLARRNLDIASSAGRDVVIPCVACYNRLRAAADPGGARPLFLLDLLAREEILDRVRVERRRPLDGLKLACYYGCVIVRPPKATGAKEWENPVHMEGLMEALGAETTDWPRKTDCCGADLGLTSPEVSKALAGKILDSAGEAGAEALVTACPLCHANLDNRQGEILAEGAGAARMPVFYFTELLGLALELPEARTWWSRHMESPAPVLARHGFSG